MKEGNNMNMFVYMGIIEEMRREGKDLRKYTLKDIKEVYKNYIRE